MESLYKLAVMVSAMDNLTGPIGKMAKSFSNFEKLIQSSKGIVDWGNRMAVSGALVQGAADSGIRALTSLLKPVMEVETSMGEMASVGIKDMNALSKAAEAFSYKWSGTTEAQFISAAYDIKGGIASLSDTAVAEFTRLAALTGKATKSTTDEMTSLFATGYGIYKNMYSDMNDMQFGNMFGAGITAAVQQFKSTGSGMSQALTTLGAAATSAQRPFEEQLAVLGMLQATMPGSESGTKYKAFIQSAAGAGKSLGLSFVDSNNQMLGMVEILGKLRGKYGETLDAMEAQQIKKAFGSDEAIGLINLLYPKIGELGDSVRIMNQSMLAGGGYIEDIARTTNTGLGEQVGILGQNISILKRSIGQELSPLIKAFVPVLQGWVMGFQNLARAHPTLVRTGLLLSAFAVATLAVVAPIITVGAGLVLLVGYTMWGFGQIGKGLTLFKGLLTSFARVFPILGDCIGFLGSKLFTFARSAIPVVAQGLRTLIPLIWSTTTALLANPITWVIVGVVALGGAIYALWSHWDQVKMAMGTGLDWLKTKFQVVPQVISGIIQSIRGKIAEFKLSGAALLQAFVSGIQSMIAKPAEVVKTGLAKLRRLLPHSDAKEGPLSTLTYSGKALINTFAHGMQLRTPFLQSVAAGAFGGLALPDGGNLGSWDMSPLGRTPSVNLREVMKESSREREATFTRDRRPIVLVMQGSAAGQSYEDIIDLAYRQLEMRDGG